MARDPASLAPQWRPPHRSRMAALIWKTFASGDLCSWSGGEIRFPAPEHQDAPHFPEFPSYYVRTEVPDWMAALLASLDAALPSSDIIHGSLDDDSLSLGAWPAAFNMPSFPSAEDAGHCLISSRVILACSDELIGPAFVDDRECRGWVKQSSWLALMMGGEQAYLTALSLAGDPATFKACAAQPDIEAIETGE